MKLIYRLPEATIRYLTLNCVSVCRRQLERPGSLSQVRAQRESGRFCRWFQNTCLAANQSKAGRGLVSLLAQIHRRSQLFTFSAA